MSAERGKVYFVGAGPGDPELITVKGQRLIRSAEVVLYAGSLVPRELFSSCAEKTEIRDSSSMTLEETHGILVRAHRMNVRIVRVHTGDPSIYGAVAEQACLLSAEGIPYEVIPGVSCAFAAAAEAGVSLTLPEGSQTVIVTRAGGRTPVPDSQDLVRLARSMASMAIYLSGTMAGKVQKKLLQGGLGPETNVVIGHRVGWPEGRVRRCSLGKLAETAREMEITGQAVFLILPDSHERGRSRLYSDDFHHTFR